MVNIKQDNQFDLFLLANIALLVLLLCWLFKQVNIGLNFMDEAYYLNWFKNAPDYPASSTSFGFVYRPFFLLFDENVVSIRKLNILINIALGFAVTSILFFLYNIKLNAVALSLVLSVSASVLLILIRQDVMLATPSYNTLVFQGLVIFCIGVIGIQQNKPITEYFSWAAFFVALGGWLVFLGKPTSAFLLMLVFLVYLRLSQKFSWQFFLGCLLLSIAFSFSSAILIDHGLSEFIERYVSGLALMQAYDAGYSTNVLQMFKLDLDSLAVSNSYVVCLFGLFVAITVFTYLFQRACPAWFKYLIKIIIFLLLFFSFAILLGFIKPMYLYREFYMLVILSSVLGIFFGHLIARRPLDRSAICLSLLFFVMPYVVAYGSGNSYWHLSISASFFWLLSGSVLLFSSQFDNRVLAFRFYSALFVFFTICALWVSAHFPEEKLKAIKKDEFVAFKVHDKNIMLLNKPLAVYFTKLTMQANKMGFVANTPIIDLTGQYGLAVFVLNGKSVGMPLLYGGHKGSNQVASLALDAVSCQTIAHSWLFIEPKGYRKLSADIIERYGINIQQDYTHSDTFRGLLYKGNPFKIGDTVYRKTNKQFLLKPINPDKLFNACKSYRNTKL